MIHRLEIDKDCVILCGDGFLEEFNNCLNKEIKRINCDYDET